MDDFDQTIQEIWEEHRNRNILCRALGPDPVLFARDVIAAWESHKSVTISDDTPDCQQTVNGIVT